MRQFPCQRCDMRFVKHTLVSAWNDMNGYPASSERAPATGIVKRTEQRMAARAKQREMAAERFRPVRQPRPDVRGPKRVTILGLSGKVHPLRHVKVRSRCAQTIRQTKRLPANRSCLPKKKFPLLFGF